MIYFDHIENELDIKGRGHVIVVKNPLRCSDFEWLMGQDIHLPGGKRYVVIGVEYANNLMWKHIPCGVKIGLIVK